jgi:hypothetical protein
MARRALICALAAMLVPALAAASEATPKLRSTAARRGHVVAVFTLGSLAPRQILVAAKARRTANGEFLRANVRLREALAPTTRNGLSRYRTRHKLKPGAYYVEVSGTAATDCLPGHCPDRWSNVLRVVVPKVQTTRAPEGALVSDRSAG